MTDLVYLAMVDYDTALGGSTARILMHSRDDAEKLRRSGKRKGFTVNAIYGMQIFTVDEAKKVIAAEKKEHQKMASKFPKGFITRDGKIYAPDA